MSTFHAGFERHVCGPPGTKGGLLCTSLGPEWTWEYDAFQALVIFRHEGGLHIRLDADLAHRMDDAGASLAGRALRNGAQDGIRGEVMLAARRHRYTGAIDMWLRRPDGRTLAERGQPWPPVDPDRPYDRTTYDERS